MNFVDEIESRLNRQTPYNQTIRSLNAVDFFRYGSLIAIALSWVMRSILERDHEAKSNLSSFVKPDTWPHIC